MTATICLPGCACRHHLSRPCSDETRAKLSMAARNRQPRPQKPETCAKLASLKTKYVSGTVWGNKEVVDVLGRNRWNQRLYLYRCTVCGTEHGPSTDAVFRRASAKCCQLRAMQKSNYRGFEQISGAYVAHVRCGAKQRGIEFAVTTEYLWQVWLDQGGRCAYTGRSLTHTVDRSRGDYGDREYTASLDRIDSGQGYVPGNVQWVHKTVNKMKWELSDGDFVAICREIVQYKEAQWSR